MGFIAKYFLFLHQNHIANAIEVVFSPYFFGIVFWSLFAEVITEGDQHKVVGVLWTEALGHILLLSLILGDKGWINFNESFVRVLPMTVYANIALIGQKAFLDNEFNPTANTIFCLVTAFVYSLFLRSPFVVILLSPIFVAVASRIVHKINDIEAATVFGLLTMTTILLGLAWGYSVFH